MKLIIMIRKHSDYEIDMMTLSLACTRNNEFTRSMINSGVEQFLLNERLTDNMFHFLKENNILKLKSVPVLVPVQEMGTIDEAETIPNAIRSLIAYSKYLCEQLNMSIAYSEHLAEQLSKHTDQFNKHIAEPQPLAHSGNYSEHTWTQTPITKLP